MGSWNDNISMSKAWGSCQRSTVKPFAKIVKSLTKILKVCQTILGHYALKG